MHRVVLPVSGILLGLFCAAGMGAAAQAPEGPLDRVYACAGVSGDAARLACFDDAVAGLRQEESAGEVAVVTREQVAAAEQKAFGLGAATLADVAPKVAARAAERDQASSDAMAMTVTTINTGADGRLRFVMENGQVWRQTDRVKLVSLGDGPWRAEVRKGALGSHFLKIGTKTAVRAKREK